MRKTLVVPGDTYGRLTLIKELDRHRQPSGKIIRRFLCRCECGVTIEANLTHLRTGHTTSCGCWRREVGVKNGGANATHGCTGTPTFKTWDTMKQRCNNPNDHKYHLYGARGIAVCDRWGSFENFLADMGEKPVGMTIDRIDNDGNYSPGNCRWATLKQQARNKRNNVILVFRGKACCIAEWAERTGLSSRAIRCRYKSGWTIEEILTTPSRKGAKP